MPTILHISDLHRDPKTPLSNKSLLFSLVKDRERYLADNPPILAPDVVVISGDLIQGTRSGAALADAELTAQYQEAYDFLCGLSKNFVDGNNDRVVIVPGNHDVCDSTFKKAIKKIDIAGKDSHTVRALTQELFKPRTRMRWSWQTLELFEIEDDQEYLRRFEHFSLFYEKFYDGKRSFPLEPSKQYGLFHYEDLKLLFAAFNSCYDNDPFNREGNIHPDCLAAVGLELRKPMYGGAVPIAVWHHSTSGSPQETDYMDRETLDIMIDRGFTIGLHGHQHRARVLDEIFYYGHSNKITVMSAGTLCGGAHSLPTGQRRSYNLITIDDTLEKGIVCLREMQNDRFDSPIWGKGILEHKHERIEFTACPLPLIVMEASMSVAKADDLMSKGRYDEAIPFLEAAVAAGDERFAKRFLLECYSKTGNSDGVVKWFYPPKTEEEFVYVIDALWELKMTSELLEVLHEELFVNSENPSIHEMIDKYSKRMGL